MNLSGWGQFPKYEVNASFPKNEDELRQSIRTGRSIARGNGRAYGDAALSIANTIQTKHLNRMLNFDDQSGQLVAESGVLLADIIKAFLPRGWFPAITPGTKFVSLGGMIAADVHGKNHHKDGSFASCVDWIDVMAANGQITRCSREQNSKLFGWTLGGMGLTGVIVRAAIRLKSVESGWIKQTTVAAENLDAAMDLFEKSGDVTYSVAWIDCLKQGAGLGRSLVMLGEHAKASELSKEQSSAPLNVSEKPKKTMPFNLPSWSLNSWSVRAFNELYFRKGCANAGQALVDWDTYFYPLDAILGWNKIYGRKGFAQFQCVLPHSSSRAGLKALLSSISDAGAGSFLAVLKQFGEQNSDFSFPMAGYTLALDFPVNRKTLALMERLDRITLDHGGRFYLAKDSRMSRQVFEQSDTRIPAFREMRQDKDLDRAFGSIQSERLGL